MDGEKPRKHRAGCLIPLAIWIVAVVAMYFVTRSPPVTEDFDDRIARRFSVTYAEVTDRGVVYRVTTLEAVRSRNPELPRIDYRLGDSDIRIDVGDVHYVSVIEEHGDWQLVKFVYNNTYMGESIYRAYDGRVEPVSFHMVSHVGQAMAALALVIPAYVLAWMIAVFRNFRDRREFDRG